MKKQLKQFFCVLLVSLLMSQEVFADVSDPVAPVGAISTSSDAEELIVSVELPEYDPDPRSWMTEEQYDAYCQTFIDHPSVFLDYPEGMIRPRFAVTLSAAAVCGLCILAAAVGFVFTWNLSSWVNGYSGYDFFSGFEQYQRINNPDDSAFWSGWDAIFGSNWGQVIFGVNPVYDAMKRYCTDEVKGYGTDQPSYNITSDSSFSIVSDGYYFGENGFFDSKKIYLSSVTSPIYHYCYLYRSSASSSKGRYFSYLVSRSIFEEDYQNSDVRSVGDLYVLNFSSSSYCDISLIVDYINQSGSCFIGEISTGEYMDVDSYFLSSDFVLGGKVATITPEKSIGDVQEKTFVSPGDTLTLPADQAAADTLAGNVSAATDAAGVAGALTGTWDLGDAQAGTDEEDPVLPWVPDITGWLEKLKQGIDAIGDKVSSIPDTLAGLRDDILSIPGQITDFFTVDTAIVGEAAAGVQEAFSDRFGGVAQLSGVFKKSYSFGMEAPVFTMAVPEFLKFAYPDTDEIVILDLRPYATWLLMVRGILVAAFWLMFAKWLLDQFDVKLHVA